MKFNKVILQMVAIGFVAILLAPSVLRADMKAGDNRIAIRSEAAIPTGANDVNQTNSIGAISGIQFLHALGREP